MNKSFWKNKNVLVTGHTGFKGSWLCLWLGMSGARVTGYALDPPTKPNLFEAADVDSGICSVWGDVRDYERLRKTIIAAKPEIIIHLAAQSVVRDSYQNPIDTYSTNVMGTVNLLEATRTTGGVNVVVNVTSDKCYENKGEFRGYRENDPMGGHDPYSSSKGCAELVTSAFRASFFPPSEYARHRVGIASTRAGNVLGGGDWTRHQLVPDIMRAFMTCMPVSIRSPRAVRPWQFVLEPLCGYLRLAEKLWDDGARFSEGWNFGPAEDDTKPVEWIVSELAHRWGKGSSWKSDRDLHPYEAPYLKLDSSKARTELGWMPRTRLPEALDWVTEWYKAYQEKRNIRRLTLEQIDRYEHLETHGVHVKEMGQRQVSHTDGR
jgi:CDP-glucose 4,6-dehydratase